MKRIFFSILLLSQFSWAQSQDVEQIIKIFDNQKIGWQVPLSEKQTTQSIVWHERTSSLSTEGIRTFVGYANGSLVGTISIYKNSLQGNVDWEGNNYQISTENGKIIITKEENHTCGTCEGGYCSAEEHSHEGHEHSFSKIKAFNINQEQFENTPEIYSDGILRVYRLAVLVDYSAYTSWFGSDTNRVKQHLAELETFMNEVYMRDIGVKFVIVDDPKLIRTSQDQEVFSSSDRNWISGGSYVTTHSTKRISGLITPENYDIGITICTTGSGYAGLAEANNGHIFDKKAAAWARQSINTIAHEIGHLFGSQHTFSEGGILTMKTEPGNGTSLMSYGFNTARDFFSLPSINAIRQSMLVNAPGYFADKEHTQKVGDHNPRGNAVFGIDTQNKAPRIDRSKVKKEYRLPKETYFQFDIKASDPDGNSLLYMAHQADITENDARSKANFLTRKASPNSVIPFIQEYEIAGSGTRTIPYTAPDRTTPSDEYTFWLGVSDGDNSQENIMNERHATQYDMVQTKVKIENGTPFRITGGIESGLNAKIYKAGEKIMLKWGVDKNIFGENSKVKISLSDDFGKTYKYVLAASTENDGEEEITLPNFEIGEISHTPKMKSAAGILKIEMLDHIAVAITENNPAFGGFQIKKSNITLVNLPKDQYIKVKEIPTAPVVTATSTCPNTPTPSVSFSEKNNGNILERTWTATDSCGNTATFTQFIEKEKEVAPLQFLTTPQDVQLACVKDIPKGEKLQLIGGTKPTQEFSQSKINTNQNGTGLIIKRTWVAKDTDAQSISHNQTILVRDYVPPVLSEYPKDKIVKNFNEIGFPKTLTATDNCGTVKEIKEGQGYKDNDTQGRTRYYHSWLAVDDSGNETYHEQIFTIDPDYTPTPPTTPPLQWAVASLPEVKVSCQSEIPSAQNPKATGGKGKITITHQDTTPSNYCNATIVRTYTAKDEDGKSITLSQNIKIEDKIAPTWNNANLPSDITINHDDPIPSQVELMANDNCGTPTVIKTERKENGKVIYTWIAKDICGNEISHQQVITIKPKPVQPISPITWTSQLPQNMRVSCAGNVPNAENLTATGGEGTLTISHTDVRSSESCANQFVITRIYTATDGVRSMQHIQKIEVNDDIAPSFVGDLPQNITIEEGQNIPTQAVLTATDNCGIANIETSEREVIENGKLKQKIYTWIAKDACGNQTHHEQIIEIKEKKVEVPNNFAKPKLYPNPTNDCFQLNIENVKGVKVYNTAGRLVKTFEPQQKYDISNLTAEVYIIAVETENGIEHIKLIKK